MTNEPTTGAAPPSMNDLIRAASGMTPAERHARYSRGSAMADPTPAERDPATGRYVEGGGVPPTGDTPPAAPPPPEPSSRTMNDLIRGGAAARGAGSPAAAQPVRDYAAFWRPPVGVPDGSVDFGGGTRGEPAFSRTRERTFSQVIREGAALVASVNPRPRVIRR